MLSDERDCDRREVVRRVYCDAGEVGGELVLAVLQVEKAEHHPDESLNEDVDCAPVETSEEDAAEAHHHRANEMRVAVLEQREWKHAEQRLFDERCVHEHHEQHHPRAFGERSDDRYVEHPPEADRQRVAEAEERRRLTEKGDAEGEEHHPEHHHSVGEKGAVQEAADLCEVRLQHGFTPVFRSKDHSV